MENQERIENLLLHPTLKPAIFAFVFLNLLFVLVFVFIFKFFQIKISVFLFFSFANALSFLFVISFLKNHFFETLLITPSRVEYNYSFLSSKNVSVPIEAIRTIDVEQNVFGKILNTGTIKIGTAATSFWEIVINNIDDPFLLKALLIEYIDKARENDRDDNKRNI